MTRKDFEFIAASLKEARERVCRDRDVTDKRRTQDIDHVARVFAERLAIVNPSFNRARFLAACGVEG